MPANLGNSAVAIGLEKVSFHFNPKEEQCERMFKLQLCSFCMLVKVMLKILQPRLQQYNNGELPDVQIGFRKSRRTRNQISIHGIIEKAREIQKNIYFCFIDYAKAFDCADHNKRWKILTFLKDMGIPYLAPEKPVCKSRSNG